MNLQILLTLLLSTIVSCSVLKPSEDDFYNPPLDLNVTDGTILKFRNTPGKLRTIYFPLNVDSKQIMVKSTDKFNNPVTIINTVIQPKKFDPTKVVVFQFAQDSSSYDCAPSYALRYGASMSTLYNQLETIPLQLILNKGWSIVATDYEGPLANFPGGKQSGYFTLDSIRAIVNSYDITGLSERSRFILWGYSGGSIPVNWASALIDEYPDIKENIIGAVIGGPVTNLTSAAVANEGTKHAGLVASAIAGLMKQYPEMDEIVRSEITEEQYQDLLYAQENCLIPILRHFKNKNFFTGTDKKVWAKSGLNIFSTDKMIKILNDHKIALDSDAPKPKIPILLYHGKNDDILPWKDSNEVYENWCEWGIDSLEFLSDRISGHMTGFLYSAPAVAKWMKDRFDGKEVVLGCKRTDKLSFLQYQGSKIESFHYVISVFKAFTGLSLHGNKIFFPIQVGWMYFRTTFSSVGLLYKVARDAVWNYVF